MVSTLAAPTRVIERLRSRVLVEHPQVERLRWPASNQLLSDHRRAIVCRSRAPFRSLLYVEIVEQGSPRRIVVEHGVSKADDITVYVGADGELIQASEA